MRVALVTDWLNQYGGAERVLEVLHDLYPTAPVYTSLYAPPVMPTAYRAWDIRTSFMQHLPLARTHHQAFLPLYPLAFEQFDFSGYDLVLSNASAFAHGVIAPPATTHVCYCLTPTRFLWQFGDYVKHEGLGWLARLLLPPLIARLRRFREHLERDMDPEPWTALEAPMVLLMSDLCDGLGLAETTPGPLIMVLHQETQFFKLSDVLRHPPQLLSYALSHQDEPEESKSYTT